MTRTAEEMQITLATLKADFGVDVTQAEGLGGEALQAWLERAEDEVFEREHAALRAQGSGGDYGGSWVGGRS